MCRSREWCGRILSMSNCEHLFWTAINTLLSLVSSAVSWGCGAFKCHPYSGKRTERVAHCLTYHLENEWVQFYEGTVTLSEFPSVRFAMFVFCLILSSLLKTGHQKTQPVPDLWFVRVTTQVLFLLYLLNIPHFPCLTPSPFNPPCTLYASQCIILQLSPCWQCQICVYGWWAVCRQVINNYQSFFASCPESSTFFSHLRNHGKRIFPLRTQHS